MSFVLKMFRLWSPLYLHLTYYRYSIQLVLIPATDRHLPTVLAEPLRVQYSGRLAVIQVVFRRSYAVAGTRPLLQMQTVVQNQILCLLLIRRHCRVGLPQPVCRALVFVTVLLLLHPAEVTVALTLICGPMVPPPTIFWNVQATIRSPFMMWTVALKIPPLPLLLRNKFW